MRKWRELEPAATRKLPTAASEETRSGMAGRSTGAGWAEPEAGSKGEIILRDVCESESARKKMSRVPDGEEWMKGVKPEGQSAMARGAATGLRAPSSGTRFTRSADWPSEQSASEGTAARPENWISLFMGSLVIGLFLLRACALGTSEAPDDRDVCLAVSLEIVAAWAAEDLGLPYPFEDGGDQGLGPGAERAILTVGGGVDSPDMPAGIAAGAQLGTEVELAGFLHDVDHVARGEREPSGDM